MCACGKYTWNFLYFTDEIGDDASIASARRAQSIQFFGQRLRIQTYAWPNIGHHFINHLKFRLVTQNFTRRP